VIWKEHIPFRPGGKVPDVLSKSERNAARPFASALSLGRCPVVQSGRKNEARFQAAGVGKKKVENAEIAPLRAQET